MRLKTFGAMALVQDDGTVNEAKLKWKQLAVLAVLAAEGAAGATRDRLIGIFWADQPIENARNNLNQALYEAREALGEDVVLKGQNVLILNSKLLPSDVAEFVEALDRGDDAVAVARYTGPFLDAVFMASAPEFERWSSGRRDYFANAFVDALSRLASTASAAGEYGAAVGHLRRAASSDGFSGKIAHALMLALAHGGDPNAALRAGLVHCTLVREELESEPDAAVKALMSDLQAGRVPAAPHPNAPSRTPPPVATTVAPDPAPGDMPSIAVLPFTNLGAESADEYLADGMTEEIINALMRLKRIRVVARTTMMGFKGTQEDVRVIGARLGVRTVLEGSVRRNGTQVRITAKLINTADGAHLWLGQFDREMDDLFTMQDEIAQSIAGTLQLSLLGIGFPPRASVSTSAYERFLRGRHFSEKRNVTNVRAAVKYFQEAAALEPRYALAMMGEADAYLRLVTAGEMAPAEAIPKVRQLAERALALDPSLAEAHAALGCAAAIHDWDWSTSAAQLQRALELNPQYQTAHLWYAAYCLAPQGRLEDALGHLRRAHRLDLISPVISTSTGMVLYLARRYDEAIEPLRNALEVDPQFVAAHSMLGRTELARGNFGAAIEAFERGVALSKGSARSLALLATAHARAGDPDEAHALLERLRSLGTKQYVSAYEPAVVHAALGEIDAAMDGFSRALEEHSPEMPLLAVDPAFDAVRRDPRWPPIAARMGLGGK